MLYRSFRKTICFFVSSSPFLLHKCYILFLFSSFIVFPLTSSTGMFDVVPVERKILLLEIFVFFSIFFLPPLVFPVTIPSYSSSSHIVHLTQLNRIVVFSLFFKHSRSRDICPSVFLKRTSCFLFVKIPIKKFQESRKGRRKPKKIILFILYTLKRQICTCYLEHG
jgi:hypothetical protein